MYLVTGATGNVGGAVLNGLLARGERVRGVVRSAETTLAGGAEAVVGDLNDAKTLVGALDGATGIFLMPGYDGAADLLAAAESAGVGRVVMLSGASAGSGDLNNAVSRYMILSENTVRESGLEWTFVRPTAFMSNTLRWLGQMKAGDDIRVQFPGARTATVDPHDIAAVIVESLVGDGHAGQIYLPTGPEASVPAERIAILGEVLGRDLRCVELSDEETKAELEATMPPTYVEAFLDFYVAGTLDETEVRSTVLDVTGMAPRSFRDWATAHADDFR